MQTARLVADDGVLSIQVKVSASYDEAKQTYTLEMEQSCKATPGQDSKEVLLDVWSVVSACVVHGSTRARRKECQIQRVLLWWACAVYGNTWTGQ